MKNFIKMLLIAVGVAIVCSLIITVALNGKVSPVINAGASAAVGLTAIGLISRAQAKKDRKDLTMRALQDSGYLVDAGYLL